MATTSKATTKWTVDHAHSEIGFRVKHMMITNVYGSFRSYNIDAETISQDFTTVKIVFSARVDSVHTGVADRDKHLKSDDFFNAESFPEIIFKSTSFNKIHTHSYELKGELTIRDITRPVTLEVEYNGTALDSGGKTKAGFSIRGSVKRNDFNLKWNVVTDTGSIVVSDEVKIVGEIQMIKQ